MYMLACAVVQVATSASCCRNGKYRQHYMRSFATCKIRLSSQGFREQPMRDESIGPHHRQYGRAIGGSYGCPNRFLVNIGQKCLRCPLCGAGSETSDRQSRDPTLHTVEYQVFAPPPILGCYVTKYVRHKALKSIVCGKLTFDEMCGIHRVGWLMRACPGTKPGHLTYHST